MDEVKGAHCSCANRTSVSDVPRACFFCAYFVTGVQIKAKAKGTMPGANGALVPGPGTPVDLACPLPATVLLVEEFSKPDCACARLGAKSCLRRQCAAAGGDHASNQRNQAAIDTQTGSLGNLGRGFDQGKFGHSFDNSAGHGINVWPGVSSCTPYCIAPPSATDLVTSAFCRDCCCQAGRLIVHFVAGFDGTNSATGTHGNTVGNVGQQSYAPQGTGFGGTTGTGQGHTGTGMGHIGTHGGQGLHGNNTVPGVGTSNSPILGGEGEGHTGTHTGHGMHGQHGHGMGTGVGAGTGMGQTGTAPHMAHGTDQRTGHVLGDDSHSYGAGVGPDHKAGHKASKATKGAQYDATGGAVDDRTMGQKIKDVFTPGSDVGKHTQH